MSCIFCKIITGDIPSKKAYEDDKVLAFYDIAPQAPTHLVIIPKEHILSMDDITEQNAQYVAHIFALIPKLAGELGLDKGYRVVCNCKEQGGQTVDHLHFHLLGGRSLSWPPG